MKTTRPLFSWIGLPLGSLLLGALSFGQIPRIAPLNPEFEQYFQAPLRAEQTTEQTHYGLVPSPVDLSYLTQQASPAQLRSLMSLTPAYDLRTLGRLTAVRDQREFGTCWAHAAYSSIESFLMPQEPSDFSENHLVNMDGFNLKFKDGGNFQMAMAYLARWGGPVNEVDDPYPTTDDLSPSPTGLTAQKHIQQTLIIPGKSSPTGNDLIKQAVMDYGAVAATYYHSSYYYNAAHSTYRYTGAATRNHAVAIVGWDDDFDKNKFLSVPAGNGAYIVRNSWGPDWGDGGYYYVSYYDSLFGYAAMWAFNSADSHENHKEIYSHDPLGWVTNLGIGTTSFWGANVFTAEADGELDAVGFYANSLNTAYTIEVRTGVENDAPRSGVLAATITGTSDYPGYRTIDLDTHATLSTGQKFSIVLKLTTPNYNYPLPIEYVIPGYSSAATAAAGQSYYSSIGEYWTDLTHWNATANFCIKGYTATFPEIAVEQPADTPLSDGQNTVSFEPTAIGHGAAAKIFTIRNPGTRSLTGLEVTTDGGNSADYVINTNGMGTTLAPSGVATFSVQFNPVGTVSHPSLAALHIASNDADESSFDIGLTGDAYSTTADDDMDGMNDWAEFRLAPLGFDWKIEQTSQVAALYANANFAGLYTPSQVQALHIDTPLLMRDPVTEHFTLTLGLKKSTDLVQWSEFPFTNPGTTLTNDGKLEFDFESQDDAAFFRLETR